MRLLEKLTLICGDEDRAKEAIDASADWFEDVLSIIGLEPASIPTLLRWQAHGDEHDD